MGPFLFWRQPLWIALLVFVCLSFGQATTAFAQQSCGLAVLPKSDFSQPRQNQAILQCGGTCYLETTHVMLEQNLSRQNGEKIALSRAQTYFNELMARFGSQSVRQAAKRATWTSPIFRLLGRLGFSMTRMGHVLDAGRIEVDGNGKLGKAGSPFPGLQKFDNSHQFAFSYSYKTPDFVALENKAISALALELENSIRDLGRLSEPMTEIQAFDFIRHRLSRKIQEHLADLGHRFGTRFTPTKVPVKNHIEMKKGSADSRITYQTHQNYLQIEVRKIKDSDLANLLDLGGLFGLTYQTKVYDQSLTRNHSVPSNSLLYRLSPMNSFMGGHAIAIVGYQKNAAGEVTHWLALNSAGSTYGDNGHFLIPAPELRRRKPKIYVLDPDRLIVPAALVPSVNT